jgi:hypothetical protein
MPKIFANGAALAFQIENVTTLRESAGIATVAVTGRVAAREALYEAVAVDDPAVEMNAKLGQLRDASERAQSLRERGGTKVKSVETNTLHFLKEKTPAGQSTSFQFDFKAQRTDLAWHLTEVLSAVLVPAQSLSGNPIASFSTGGSGQLIVGTDKAKREVAELSDQIDKYVLSVTEAEKALVKRFAAEGRDANGNFLFPPHDSMPGERFAATRMRLLSAEELQNWPEENLQYAINEIFARHGAIFDNKKLSTWFHQFSWYRPQPGATFDQIEASLPDIERQNVKVVAYARVVTRENKLQRERAVALQNQQAIAAQREQQKQAVRAQQEAAAARRAQEEAALRAQQDAAAEQFIGGLLQGVTNALQRR